MHDRFLVHLNDGFRSRWAVRDELTTLPSLLASTQFQKRFWSPYRSTGALALPAETSSCKSLTHPCRRFAWRTHSPRPTWSRKKHHCGAIWWTSYVRLWL